MAELKWLDEGPPLLRVTFDERVPPGEMWALGLDGERVARVRIMGEIFFDVEPPCVRIVNLKDPDLEGPDEGRSMPKGE
jgi:hypothetical protein